MQPRTRSRSIEYYAQFQRSPFLLNGNFYSLLHDLVLGGLALTVSWRDRLSFRVNARLDFRDVDGS